MREHHESSTSVTCGSGVLSQKSEPFDLHHDGPPWHSPKGLKFNFSGKRTPRAGARSPSTAGCTTAVRVPSSRPASGRPAAMIHPGRHEAILPLLDCPEERLSSLRTRWPSCPLPCRTTQPALHEVTLMSPGCVLFKKQKADAQFPNSHRLLTCRSVVARHLTEVPIAHTDNDHDQHPAGVRS